MIWFFVIVVIIVVAAGGVWWLQHYFQTRIKNLDAQVEAIDVGALSSQIRSIEQLKLTGDSLATFSKLLQLLFQSRLGIPKDKTFGEDRFTRHLIIIT